MATTRQTTRQRKLAQVIIENSAIDKPLNSGEMLAKVGYSKNLVKQPGRIIESEGVQEALNEYGFTEDNAKRVVAEILLDKKQRGETRLNAADKVFKVRGTYAPEKSITAHIPLIVKIIDGKDNGNTEGVQQIAGQ